MQKSTKSVNSFKTISIFYYYHFYLKGNISIARPIHPTVSPSLVHLGAVKFRFSQFHVDHVVYPAEPKGQGRSAGRVGRQRLHVGPQIFGAVFAGEKLGEERDEVFHIVLRLRRRLFRIISGHRVEEGPSVGTQFGSVQRTVSPGSIFLVFVEVFGGVNKAGRRRGSFAVVVVVVFRSAPPTRRRMMSSRIGIVVVVVAVIVGGLFFLYSRFLIYFYPRSKVGTSPAGLFFKTGSILVAILVTSLIGGRGGEGERHDATDLSGVQLIL